MKPEDAERWLPILRDYATFVLGVVLIILGFIRGNTTLVIVGSSLGGLGVVHYLLAIFLGK